MLLPSLYAEPGSARRSGNEYDHRNDGSHGRQGFIQLENRQLGQLILTAAKQVPNELFRCEQQRQGQRNSTRGYSRYWLRLRILEFGALSSETCVAYRGRMPGC